MPIPLKPYKLKCPKCGYSKVVAPKSDVINPMDLLSTCQKCGLSMQKVELSILDKVLVWI